MNAEDIRKKLAAGQPAAERLVELLVEDTLQRPLRELVAPLETGKAVVEALRAWTASERAVELQEAMGHRARSWLQEQRMTLGELTGRAVEDAFLDLAARPYVPSKDLLIFLLDREPMRLLLRELFHDGLITFGNKVRAPVASNPLAKGLGGLGRFAKERARSTSLGAIATDVAERLTDEMERQVEKRAFEFADAALEGLIRKLADLLSNPARAEQQAALREALVEGIFSLSLRELAEEWGRDDPRERGRIVRRGLGLWVATDDAVAQVVALFEGLAGELGDRSLRELLEELELVEAFRGIAGDAVRRRLQPFLEGEAFAAWLGELLS